MKRSLLLTSAVLCSVVCFGQGTSPSSSSSSPKTGSSASATPQLKSRGPEAVAQAEPNKVVAVIDGKQITAKDALGMLKAIPADQRKQYESNLANVLQQIYMSKQIAGEAVKMNLDQQSPWKEQIELNRDTILTRAYLNQEASKSPGGSQDPQQYYSAHPEEFDQLKLSGIFVSFNPPGTPANASASKRTEEEARDKAADLEKKIKAGGDFAALARTDSDNQQAAARGGELGTFTLGSDSTLPPDVKTAVQKLQSGQVSEPVRIPNAFLIIKVDNRNKLSFDEAKSNIVTKLQAEKSQAVVKQEMDKYKIQVQDPEFFSASGSSASNVPSLAHPSGGSGSSPSNASATKPQAQR